MQIWKLKSQAAKGFSLSKRMMYRTYERRVNVMSGETCSKRTDNYVVHLMPNAKRHEMSLPISLFGVGVERNIHQNTTKLCIRASTKTLHDSVSDGQLFSTQQIRHNQELETPLPIYLRIMIHTKTCKCDFVDILYDLGWRQGTQPLH